MIVSKSIKLLLIGMMITAAVSAQQDSTAHLKKGSQLKGFYTVGGLSVVGGATMGFVINAFDDHPREGLPFITSTIATAPSSMLGIGIGYLFAKKHSTFSNGFHLGTGVAYSSPVFSEFVPGNAHRAGPQLRITSPQLGAWRYNLSFSLFFSEEYEFERISAYRGETNLSWWELDLNLQYIIDINKATKIYPFIGTQYNSITSGGSQLNYELLANYGVGADMSIAEHWKIFSEFQFTVDPDRNPGNSKISIGLMRRL